MRSSAENPNYHRSNLIKTFTVAEDSYTLRNDYFGSSYVTLFKNKVNRSNPYTIRQNDRLDLLSQRNYGTTSLWWAIAIFNPNIYHPLLLSPGLVINIPTKAAIDEFFSAYRAGQLNSTSNTNIEV